MEQWFRRDNLIILVLAGVLLVIISFPIEDIDENNGVSMNKKKEAEAFAETSEIKRTEGYDNLYDYAEYLEKELEDILADMKGVGRSNVMITLEATEEQIVEKDEGMERNNTTESDSNGGNRMVYQTDSIQETVYEKQGNYESPYVTKTILPKISGILIVAEGAGVGNNTKNITEIAQALFDVEAHKIKVVPMK